LTTPRPPGITLQPNGKCSVSTWIFVKIDYFFLFVNMLVIIGKRCSNYYRLVNYGVVLLLVVVSFLVMSTTGAPMSRGNVDTKPQRRRFITQQHTQQPVTSPPIPQYNP
jgi:hypothetical protein